MRRAQRLRTRRDFTAVYRRGRSYRGQVLTVRVLRTNGPRTRFGFAVGGEIGKAVVRNKVKRRLREAARSLPLEEGYDIVIQARRGAEERSYHELRDTLAALLQRAGVLREEVTSA